MAFATSEGSTTTVHISEVGAASSLELVECRGGPLVELAWSPDGRHVTYHIGGSPPGFGDQIGWVSTSASGELGRVAGIAFAWAPKGAALYVADVDDCELARIEIDSGRRQRMAEMVHYRDERFAPQVVPSPAGDRLVFTCRDSYHDAVRVWCVGRKDGEREARQVTWIPGADVYVLPFWSPRGGSLGLHMVHTELERTGLIVVRDLQGDGELFYRREATHASVRPAWAPNGRVIALWRGTPEAPELVLLDLATRSLEPLARPGELSGDLRFLDDEHLLVDGGSAATVVRLVRSSG